MTPFRKLVLLILVFASASCFAQSKTDQARRVKARIDSAVHLSDQGKYEAADGAFRMLLKSIRSVPSDVTFYFGKNSFLLGKYRQSVDWLNKYIQLKGTQGQHSEQAMEWLGKAEAELLKANAQEAKRAAEVLSGDYYIDCGPAGKVVCPTCKGSTVIVKKNYFGDVYKTCPSCSKRGYLTCDEYNKLIKGKLITD